MDREIKFRGKSIRNGKWLYGDLLRNVDNSFAIVPPFEVNMQNECARYEVDPETIGQFIGLHDKNGKEIYEGDILSFYHNSEKFICVVEWNNEVGAWCIRLKYEVYVGIRPLGEWLCDFKMEIIGNIYDNKQLLED